VCRLTRPKFEEVHEIIERLSAEQADFLCSLPPDGTSIVTEGPEMRVLIRMLWLSGFRLVEVQGPIGQGERVNLNKAGRVVASGLRRQRRGDPSPLS
jgi:hypothetical protein